MSIPTEKRLATLLKDVALQDGTRAKQNADYERMARYVRKLMKAHGAAMFKKGQIS